MWYQIESLPLKNSCLHSGLVDAKDDEDLRTKLLSCKNAWNEKESVYGSARLKIPPKGDRKHDH